MSYIRVYVPDKALGNESVKTIKQLEKTIRSLQKKNNELNNKLKEHQTKREAVTHMYTQFVNLWKEIKDDLIYFEDT